MQVEVFSRSLEPAPTCLSQLFATIVDACVGKACTSLTRHAPLYCDDIMLQSPGGEDAGLAQANVDTQSALKDKGFRRLVFIHEFAVSQKTAAQGGNAAPLELQIQQALTKIWAGFDQAKTTVHLYSEPSQNLAVRLWLATDEEVKDLPSLKSLVPYCGENDVRFDVLGRSVMQVFPEVALVE